MEVFTTRMESIGDYIISRPVNPDVAGPAAFSKARTWIADCLDGHEKCPSSRASALPTRVIEIVSKVGEDFSLRLRETSGEKGSYTALSYVWGANAAQIKTTKANLEAHRRRIEYTSLPRTLRDAIACTHELGLKDLWVDSLCIIQDSEDDKAKEIMMMSSIYKNAYITISAAVAKSCDEGFLKPRQRLKDIKKSCFKLSVVTPKSRSALNEWMEEYRAKPDVLDYKPHWGVEQAFENSIWKDPGAWHEQPSTVWLVGSNSDPDGEYDLFKSPSLDREPISRRAWTLQESWLSPRILIYGLGQLRWKCNTTNDVDGGTMGWEMNIERKNLFEGGYRLTTDAEWSAFNYLWRNLVEEYTSRELGVSADKLNAMQGIAQELMRQSQDEYLAGLWRRNIVGGLAWYQDITRKGSEALCWSTSRTCPSWSWIKVDGPVNFSHAEKSQVIVESASMTRQEITGQHPNLSLVVEGSITITAPVSTLATEETSFQVWLDSNASWPAFSNVIHLDGALTNPDFVHRNADNQLTLSTPGGLKFLELSSGRRDGRQNIAAESRGLLLVPALDQLGKYKRTGFFVVALEHDIDSAMSGENLVIMFSVESGNVVSTPFGEIWKKSLRMETVTII